MSWLAKLKEVFLLEPCIKMLSALLFGYVEFLNYYSCLFGIVMKKAQLNLEPLIRVVPRATGYYKNNPPKKELSLCELQQILQGDAPYFFRYFNSDEIYYLNIKTNKPLLANLSSGLSFPLQEQMLSNKSQLNNGISLKKTGSLQLLGYFFDNKFYRKSVYKKINQFGKKLKIIQ